jgi:hypothetical protein
VRAIDGPGVPVGIAIGVTAVPDSATYAVAPFGAIAIAVGFGPTGIGVSGVFVARLIGVTLALLWLATYAVLPSGVIAIPKGAEPTGIGFPGVFVATVIGVTASESSLAT